MEHYWRFSVIVVVILLLFKQCVFLPLKYLFQRTRLHLQRMAAFICNRTLPIAAATVAADAPPAAAKVSDDADEDDVRNIPIVPTVNVAQFLDDGAKQLVTFRQGISQRIATYDKLNAVLHKHFQLVGADTLVYILSFLDGPSVSAFQGVNRFCRHIGVRGQVWLRLCHCELKLNGIGILHPQRFVWNDCCHFVLLNDCSDWLSFLQSPSQQHLKSIILRGLLFTLHVEGKSYKLLCTHNNVNKRCKKANNWIFSTEMGSRM